jgi:hypothetical protein
VGRDPSSPPLPNLDQDGTSAGERPVGQKVTEGLQDSGHPGIGISWESIVHDEALPLVFQEIRVPQVSEVAGSLGLGNAQDLFHLTNANGSVVKHQPHDGQACFVGEGLEDSAEDFHL